MFSILWLLILIFMGNAMNECFLKGTTGKWLGIRIIGVN